MNRLAVGFVALLSFLLVAVPAERLPSAAGPPVSAPTRSALSPSTTTISLDGVTLELATSFLSDPTFVTSDPDSAIQMATAVEREPLFRELSITAVPFGVSPPTEALPPAGPGLATRYRAALRTHREGQLGHPHEGAAMDLFGESVTGSRSVVSLQVHGDQAVRVEITEAVVEAGRRLWIVRASQELDSRATLQPSTATSTLSPSRLVLKSRDLASPSTSLASARQSGPMSRTGSSVTAEVSDLPLPTWWEWEGECDADWSKCDACWFYEETNVRPWPLGAEYRGMQACGPRPYADGGPWRWVSFGVGQSQIEWQCPELSKRFLYLAYGIPPYGANGNDMVSNYSGDLLEKVWNCTAGRAPQPDDVLSYGATSMYGHTSVVTASDVDADGNGTIEVIEQNSSRHGHNTLYVNDWCVTSYTDVIGWLHHPGWSVVYYADAALTDRCANGARPDTYLFEIWEDTAPAEGCPTDHFSVHYSRSIDFPGGDYTFALGYDDGARLRIDGETVIDGWGTADQHYETRHLAPGYHQVSVAYYDRYADAALTAFWWGPGFELAREERKDSHWYAEHWGNPALWWDPVVTAVEGDGPLDHQWSWGGPDDSLPADYFSSRFRRTVPLDPGRWRFDLFADDGVRLWIDDLLVVDEWQPQRAWFTPTVTIGGGEYELAVEYYENAEVADIWLDWEQVSDAVTPTVWVTLPLTGTVVNSCPMTVEAQLGEGVGPVDRVEFHAFYDDRWHHLGDDHSAPFSRVWDCLFVDDQRVWLTVHVWEEAGGESIDLGERVAVNLDHLEYCYLPLVRKLYAQHP